MTLQIRFIYHFHATKTEGCWLSLIRIKLNSLIYFTYIPRLHPQRISCFFFSFQHSTISHQTCLMSYQRRHCRLNWLTACSHQQNDCIAASSAEKRPSGHLIKQFYWTNTRIIIKSRVVKYAKKSNQTLLNDSESTIRPYKTYNKGHTFVLFILIRFMNIHHIIAQCLDWWKNIISL